VTAEADTELYLLSRRSVDAILPLLHKERRAPFLSALTGETEEDCQKIFDLFKVHCLNTPAQRTSTAHQQPEREVARAELNLLLLVRWSRAIGTGTM
jgi:hypothetical protein